MIAAIAFLAAPDTVPNTGVPSGERLISLPPAGLSSINTLSFNAEEISSCMISTKRFLFIFYLFLL